MEFTPLVFNYKVYRLERDSPNFGFLVGKYASLSLRALSTNPEAFGVAYATESSFTSAEYIARLLRPELNVFVCVAHAANLPEHEQNIERGHWISMITQIGPTSKEVFWLPESGAPEPMEDALETKWHQTATWVDPAHRGKGVAALMIDAAMAYAQSRSAKDVVQVRTRAFTGPMNQSSQSLYGRAGFATVGKCTVTEAMAGNGNSALPILGRTDWPLDFLHSRVGLVMERVVMMP